MVVLAALQFRLLGSHLGRVLRAVRDDDVAARSYGIRLDRYKALAFAVRRLRAPASAAASPRISTPTSTTRRSTRSFRILALTIVILGGMGNVTGAIVGSVLLVGLPEVFRVAAEYRVLIYGLVLLLLVRFRPQGLMGTV